MEASENFYPNLFDTSIESAKIVAAERQVPGRNWVGACGGQLHCI
jgi:hypothetical protein